MQFLDLKVKTAIIFHGYDKNNKAIEEHVNETEYVRKIVAIDRIRSVSEEYILVSSGDGREMYWHYQGSLEDLKAKL